MSEVNPADYRAIFYPSSLAVIGASESAMKFGGMFLRALLNHGYRGKLYPVNPKAGEIMGLKSFPQLSDVPGPVEFAVITVPADKVPAALRECARKKVKGAEILTAGFREAGPAGEALEKEALAIARAGRIRLIGPNCFGVYSPEVGLTLMPGADFSRQAGPVGFLSQSGGGTCDAAYLGRGRGVYFSTAVSYGNGCDLEAAELLRYFSADPKTRMVGAYLEGVRDGREFSEALRSCCLKKPVVILKGGLSEQGERGTLGHTGSLAGSQAAWTAAIKSAGAIPARDLRDLIECLMALNCLPGFTGGGCGILAGGGLRCVEGLDFAGRMGFPVPALDPEPAGRIQAMLPGVGGRGGNPVDLANPVMSPQIIAAAMEVLAEREDIHFLVLYQMLFYLYNELRRVMKALGDAAPKIRYHEELAAAAERLREKTGKPLVAILPDLASDPEHHEVELGRLESRLYYTTHGVPCFDTGEQAFSVLRRVADYYRWVRGEAGRS